MGEKAKRKRPRKTIYETVSLGGRRFENAARAVLQLKTQAVGYFEIRPRRGCWCTTKYSLVPGGCRECRLRKALGKAQREANRAVAKLQEKHDAVLAILTSDLGCPE